MVVGMSAWADEYVKVTSAPSDWSGEYLVVYEKSKTEGLSWIGTDAASNTASYTISNNTITAAEAITITVAKETAGGYSVKVNGGDNDGKYISSGTSAPSYTNALKFIAAIHSVDFGMDEEGHVLMSQTTSSGKVYFLYNNSTNNLRFRFYKDTNLGTFKSPYLYKKSGGETPSTPTSYTISLAKDIVGGTISANPTSAVEGTTISIAATPAEGYNFVSWNLTGATPASATSANTTFKMPASNVTVSATFEKEAAPVVTTFSSLEELVAADLTSGTTVTVSFENVPIKSIFTTAQGYRNGIYFDIQKGGKDIEIYYQNVPEEWVVGGKVSGTMTCPWKLYSGTWELAPNKDTWAWTNLTYTAPADVVTLTSIAVSGTPTKKEYVEGDKFETAGLVVTGTYSDNSTKEITTDAKWTVTPSTLTAGTTSVKVVAKVGQITSAEYTVSGLTVKADAQNVTFDLTKDQTTTATTEKLEWVNTAVTMTAAKGSSSTNTNNFYPGKGSTSTRFYTNSILSLTPASGIKISSIVVTTTTDNYASSLAESTWTNATTKINGTIVTITPTDGTIAVSAVLGGTVGATSVKVYYEGEAKASVSKIELSGSYQTEFTKGDAFSSTGMVVTATYTDGNTKDVTSKVTVSGYNASETGIQTITVSYTEEGKTVETTYEVKVTAPLSKAEEGYEAVDFTTIEPYASLTGTQSASLDVYQGQSFVVTFSKGEGSTAPKYYNNGIAARCYAGNTISITGAENIKNVLVNYVSGYVDDGAKTEIDGKKATITFSKTCRFTSIVVVYANPTLAIGSTGYATYYNSKVAYIMPEGCTGSIFTVAGGLKATYEAGDAVPADEALVISGTPGDKELVLTTTNKSNSAGSNDLKGTDEEQELEEYGGFYYYALSVDKEGKNVGFYWMNSTGAAFKNGAHKAYLMAAGSPANAKNFIFGETTAIKTIATATDAKIYDLTGREVKSPKAGIYVVNGVKKYIK